MAQYYDNPSYNAAFDRWVDITSKLLIKYGPAVLEKLHNKEAKPPDTRKHENEQAA